MATHPVGGVSWYEAAAYARFAGKQLPTLFHWYWAAFVGEWPFIVSEYIIPGSNFGGEGTAPVGTFDRISPAGAFDMAGNVREWVWNKSGETRFLLGGGWDDPKYSFNQPNSRSPFNRDEHNGFRLFTPLDKPDLTPAHNPIEKLSRDYRVEQPVSDEIFEVYRRLYAYDASPLNAELIKREDAEHWMREEIEIDAAYGNERLTAFLYLPHDVEPPYQPIVYFPGAYAIYRTDNPSVAEEYHFALFLLRSGYAVLFPVYKGTFERGTGLSNSAYQNETNSYREHVIQWSKDLGRSLDYLETRSDITMDRLGYFGISWGASTAPMMIAVEPRIKAAVLVVGGMIPTPTQPEVDPLNFLTRVTVPTRMVNLSADYVFPLETSAKPFYKLLGGVPKDMIVLVGAGHFTPRKRIFSETLDWFDRFPAPKP
jgi:dienelactone hydrolase